MHAVHRLLDVPEQRRDGLSERVLPLEQKLRAVPRELHELCGGGDELPRLQEDFYMSAFCQKCVRMADATRCLEMTAMGCTACADGSFLSDGECFPCRTAARRPSCQTGATPAAPTEFSRTGGVLAKVRSATVRRSPAPDAPGEPVP